MLCYPQWPQWLEQRRLHGIEARQCRFTFMQNTLNDEWVCCSVLSLSKACNGNLTFLIFSEVGWLTIHNSWDWRGGLAKGVGKMSLEGKKQCLVVVHEISKNIQCPWVQLSILLTPLHTRPLDLWKTARRAHFSFHFLETSEARTFFAPLPLGSSCSSPSHSAIRRV